MFCVILHSDWTCNKIKVYNAFYLKIIEKRYKVSYKVLYLGNTKRLVNLVIFFIKKIEVGTWHNSLRPNGFMMFWWQPRYVITFNSWANTIAWLWTSIKVKSLFICFRTTFCLLIATLLNTNQPEINSGLTDWMSDSLTVLISSAMIVSLTKPERPQHIHVPAMFATRGDTIEESSVCNDSFKIISSILSNKLTSNTFNFCEGLLLSWKRRIKQINK